jgi:D-3-phosphoglycerate dehydrogenase
MGCETHVDAGLKDETLADALRKVQPEVLIVRSTKVRVEHFEAAGSMSLVVRAGAGVNTIDLESASERGVYVSNCPGKNAVAVAELAWAHILNADRRVADGVRDLRSGKWRKKHYAKNANGIKGRTLGLVGFGSIGRAVADRAKAFEMNVVAFDPGVSAEAMASRDVEKKNSAQAVAEVSDVLSVHVGLNEHTRGLMGEEVLGALKAGAIFVNTSRGPVVDEAALRRVVVEKGVRAGLDVFCGEPAGDGDWESDLLSLDGVYGTHHIGASTEEAQEAVALEACRVIQVYADTGNPENCVNLAAETPATHLLVVRHRDEVGVLSNVLEGLKQAEINVQNMENIVFSSSTEGSSAACARIQVVGQPSDALLDSLSGRASILEVKLLALEGP